MQTGEHQLKTGVSADEHLLRLCAENIRKELLCLGNAGKHTVIAAVIAALRDHAGISGQCIHERKCQIKLFRAGLAACHIQAELLRLKCIVCILRLLKQGCKRFGTLRIQRLFFHIIGNHPFVAVGSH